MYLSFLFKFSIYFFLILYIYNMTINNKYQPLYVASDSTITSVEKTPSNLQFCEVNNSINTISTPTIINQNITEDLNLSAYDGTSINPIIQINNTHQHVNITSNLNVASNLNVNNFVIKKINHTNITHNSQENVGVGTSTILTSLPEDNTKYSLLSSENGDTIINGYNSVGIRLNDYFKWDDGVTDTSNDRINVDSKRDSIIKLRNAKYNDSDTSISTLQNTSANESILELGVKYLDLFYYNSLPYVSNHTAGIRWVNSINNTNYFCKIDRTINDELRFVNNKDNGFKFVKNSTGDDDGVNTDLLTITNTTTGGNVGINTSSPQTPLHIYDTGDGTTGDTTNETLLLLESKSSADAGVNDFNPISIDFKINQEGEDNTVVSRISSVIAPMYTSSGHGTTQGEQSTALIFSTTDHSSISEKMRIGPTGSITFKANSALEKTSVTDTSLVHPRFYHPISSLSNIYIIADYVGPRTTGGSTVLRNFVCVHKVQTMDHCYYGWQLITGSTTTYNSFKDEKIALGTSGTNETLAYLKMSVTSDNHSTHEFDPSAFTLNFTGQHRCVPNNIELFNNVDNYIGYIVCSSGKYKSYNVLTKELLENKSGILINESLPIIELSNKKQKKNVFGVISNKEDEREYGVGAFVTKYPTINDEQRLYINSVGEGAIWIVNTNGNLENGDYIQSSDVIGHGEKQDDDILHNYTVAKITCDCDFTLNSEDYNCIEFIDSTSGNTYRKAFVGCTYHCG